MLLVLMSQLNTAVSRNNQKGTVLYTRLYLIRHGQTVFNTEHLIQGRCDSPLTDLGREQARCVARYFRDHGIAPDAAFCSLAERACDTLEIIWGGSYVRLAGLRERDFGSLEGQSLGLLPSPIGDFPVPHGGEVQAGLEQRMNSTIRNIMLGAYDDALAECASSDSSNRRPEIMASEGGAVTAGCPIAGRSDLSIDPVAVMPPQGVRRDSSCGGSVVVVSHGAACKAFSRVWRDRAQAEIPYPFPNCEILIYDFDSVSFTLVETANPAAELGGTGLPL